MRIMAVLTEPGEVLKIVGPLERGSGKAPSIPAPYRPLSPLTPSLQSIRLPPQGGFASPRVKIPRE